MLLYFKVANFKSIHDAVSLQFSAAGISEHRDSNVIPHKGGDLLRSILLYGPNASGKSKILDALVFMKDFINRSAIGTQRDETIQVEPFAFFESSTQQPSFFEMGFILAGKKYRYGFELSREFVHKEWLLESKAGKRVTEYPVFLRIGQDVEVDYERFENAKGIETRMKKTALFLSVASQWNVLKAKEIDEWFASILTIQGVSDIRYREFTLDLLNEKKYGKLVDDFIQKADLGIRAIEVVEIPIDIDELFKDTPDNVKDLVKSSYKQRSEKIVLASHQVFDEKRQPKGEVLLTLDRSESEGTKKYFNLLGLIIRAIWENRLVVIDEFDAKMHSLLSKAILRLFNSKKLKSNAQLIAACHDTALLDKELLRRDQVYFIEKDTYGATHAVSLVEYKIRKEVAYDENYLEGRYGAIPFIGELENLIADGKERR